MKRTLDLALPLADLGYLGASVNGDTLVAEALAQLRRDLFILDGEDVGQRLDQRDAGPDGVVKVGKLDADGASADDAERLRLRRQVHRLKVGQDVLAVWGSMRR